MMRVKINNFTISISISISQKIFTYVFLLLELIFCHYKIKVFCHFSPVTLTMLHFCFGFGFGLGGCGCLQCWWEQSPTYYLVFFLSHSPIVETVAKELSICDVIIFFKVQGQFELSLFFHYHSIYVFLYFSFLSLLVV